METDSFFYQLLKQLPETLFALLDEPLTHVADYRFDALEEVLIRRYHELDRAEIRRMFKLHDIRKTRVWQEAHEEGHEEGIEKGRALEKQELVAQSASQWPDTQGNRSASGHHVG